MPNPVIHWEYAVKDAKKSQEFYAQLFGWKIDANNPMTYGLVYSETGRGIDGGITESPDDSNHQHIFVEVDDLQAYLDKAVKLGAKVIMPVTVIPNMVTFAVFEDPSGIHTGLVKSEGNG